MQNLDTLLQAFPKSPDWTADWEAIEGNEALTALIEGMKNTPQDKGWHGEGDVWTHTKMVCGTMAEMKEFRSLPLRQRQELFLAALLHDVGKIVCTREEMGRLAAPHHGSTGSRMARAFLWKEMGLAGTKEAQNFRETVCCLIRYHTSPAHIWEEEDELRLVQIAANGALAEDFQYYMLSILAEADMLGRIAADRVTLAKQAEFSRLLAEETHCLHEPRKFASSYAERAYLAGRLNWPDAELYDDTWGEVIVLAGLPGTGKDTWIKAHCAGLPVISLDDLRLRLGITHKDDQGPVIAAANEQAKAYLRKKQPFVWNATSLTKMLRKKRIDLVENYGARVRIVFLETSWEEGLHRNTNRPQQVPQEKIEKMLGQMEPPERFEAQEVEWRCV